ncbi:MAG: hydrogenase maturation protein HypF [Solirubrobacteraceae bacterium]|nr:hydrogenase maturation protein HypF [Solirubrobacteraceae bacterium]
MSTAAEGMPPSSASARRVRVRVDGTVQGVGYRPFVYRLADELGVAGWVLNDERGVLVEAEGRADVVEAFVARLRSDAPPLADVRAVEAEDVPALDEPGFQIVASERGGAATAPVTPDSATCADCLAELADPGDRRYRYPFLNCTNCGPRFTIVEGIPYDRPATTMAGFVMCAACQAEYEDPLDRRFHAQPNACPACGPQVRLLERDGTVVDSEDPLRAAVADLLDGRILAIKGLGGYHLACRADSQDAVAGLRARKHREDRPFALLVADVAAARALAEIGDGEEALLCSRERPIVLAPRLPDAPIADAVAPRAPELGIMLPYTPLHQLLAGDAGVPLVMTSGNVSDEPIAFEDADALDRLAPIADRFLVHDRPIATRTDDSVVRVVRGRPLLMRRSRGYVPASLDLPVATARHLLGTGAEQKNAFCVAKGDRAWSSHHIGDVKNFETLTSLRDGVAHFEALFEVSPEVVAHDLHPDYLSTRYAQEREGVELVGVQHHHAHFAATLAEHGERGPAVGAIYDGTGYGADGTIWGGEILTGGLADFDRAGRLAGVWMPGGEGAIREPWRMACSWLTQMNERLPAAFESIAQQRWNMVARMVLRGVGCTSTSSAGRLFDAVAALCGVRLEVSYEGQAAIEFEALAEPGAAEPYPFLLEPHPPAVMNPKPAILAVLADLEAGVPVPAISARFHAGFAAVTVVACVLAAERAGVDLAVLSGGVFQNRLLLELTSAGLEDAGLRVLVPERLPPNDGQIAFGQVAVAAARLAR